MYRERPSARTSGLVLWESVSSGASTRILPDGCMDVVFLDGRPVVAGADSVARRFVGERGMRCVGARFAPGLLPAVLGLSAGDLVDRVVDLDGVDWPAGHGESADVLADRVLSAGDPLDRLDAELESWVRLALASDARRVASLLSAGVPVAEVAFAVGYSARQLQRRSVSWFGYGPKHLASICRLQRAVVLAGTAMSGAEIAAAAGYADQPHLARDARRLGGAPFAELTAN